MYFLHLSAVDNTRKEYEKRGRRTVSTRPLQECWRGLSDHKMRFNVMMAAVGSMLDRHPEVLECMKTAFTLATVPDGDEPVLTIVQSHSFTEAPTASALIRTLAPIVNFLNDSHLETLVRASGIKEAIEMYEAYLKTKIRHRSWLLRAMALQSSSTLLHPTVRQQPMGGKKWLCERNGRVCQWGRCRR